MVCHEELAAPSVEMVPTKPTVGKPELEDAEACTQAMQEQEGTGKQASASADAKSKVTPMSTSASSSSMWLLGYCFAGILTTFTVNGMALEQLTSVHAMGENSLTCVTALVFAIFAVGLKKWTREPASTLPHKYFLLLSLLAFISTITSVIALRYVSFITRVLGKSCKSIPVMLLGVCLGKRYALKKYVSVALLSVGVAVFLYGSHKSSHKNSQSQHHDTSDWQMLFGLALLLVSLVCDGATGALEDKYMHEYSVGAFELMLQLNMYKAAFAGIGVVVTGETATIVPSLEKSFLPLLALSISGAAGQAFIFYTISKFGALTTSIMGTMRKVVSIALSVTLFHHVLNGSQFFGLVVAFGAISINWLRCSPQFQTKDNVAVDSVHEEDALSLLEESPVLCDASECDDMQDTMTEQQQRALELLLQWESTSIQAGTAAV